MLPRVCIHRPLKICFGKQGHRRHNVTRYDDGQPRRPIVT